MIKLTHIHAHVPLNLYTDRKIYYRITTDEDGST